MIINEITDTNVEPVKAECCINCGSLGIVHFDEGEKNTTNVFHRCLRCLGEYSGCSFGLTNRDPRSRLL